MPEGEHSHGEIAQQLQAMQNELAALRADLAKAPEQASAAAAAAQGTAETAAADAYDAKSAIQALEQKIADLSAKLDNPPAPESPPIPVPMPAPVAPIESEGTEGVQPPPANPTENKPVQPKKKGKGWFD